MEKQTEYISREAVLEAVQDYFGDCLRNYDRGATRDGIKFYLSNTIPAADVAPVVRCKVCRFYEVEQSKMCDMHHRAADENDYCSYGVRKKTPADIESARNA